MLPRAFNALNDYCTTLSDEQFFYQPENKWSAALQVKHLTTSTNMARLALVLPRFMVKLIGGKSNRASRTYEELVNRYHQKLEQGGKASGRYIPKPIDPSYGKTRLLSKFGRSMHRFGMSLQKNWKEADLEPACKRGSTRT